MNLTAQMAIKKIYLEGHRTLTRRILREREIPEETIDEYLKFEASGWEPSEAGFDRWVKA